MNRCRFESRYYDYDQNRMRVFSCQEESLERSEMCQYHDPLYSIHFPDRVAKSFIEKIKTSISTGISLICIGYNLPNVSIKETFEKPVYFLQCNFQQISFIDSTFKKADFGKSVFHEKAFFSGCRFTNKTEFFEVIFKDEVYFVTAEFQDVNFGLSQFNKFSSFERCKFHGDSDFEIIVCNDYMDFGKTIFEGQVKFRNANFQSNVTFLSLFKSRVDFSLVNFKERAYLGDSEFEAAQFYGAVFHDEADFEGSKFHGECKFEHTIFAIANFDNTIFEKNVNFSNAKFDEAYFEESYFYDTVTFGYSKFEGEAYFIKCKFKSDTYFNTVMFESQAKVLFDGDLSRVSFANTDVTRVRFDENTFWGEDDGYTILEDRFARKHPSDADLGSILAIYRNLRENYEFRLKYDEAGKFFIKEMNLKREFKEK